jgi:hypothetical protein
LLAPLSGAEQRAVYVYVPWTKERLRRAPEYEDADIGGPLGLGEYKLRLTPSKEQEALAYWGDWSPEL